VIAGHDGEDNEHLTTKRTVPKRKLLEYVLENCDLEEDPPDDDEQKVTQFCTSDELLLGDETYTMHPVEVLAIEEEKPA
jgi:hypothetical protein